MRRPFLLAVCAIGALCLAAPAAALAGTATSDGTTITYTAASGEQNNVTVSPSEIGFGCDAPAGQVCVEDSGAPVAAAGSCVLSADEAHCPGSRFVTDLGDMDDGAFVGGSMASEMSGGPGDDTLDGGGGADVLRGGGGEDDAQGGAGDDEIFGDAGDDIRSLGLNGGAGQDIVHGGDGADSVGGGIGNDQLFGDAGDDVFFGDSGDDQVDGGADDDEAGPEPGNDTYAGGAGFDVFRTCSAPASPPMAAIASSVSLDDRPNDTDCEALGTNNIRSDVEDVQGDFGPDTLVGNASTNQLRGFRDDDVITGGPNSDLLMGDRGDDTINAQDGAVDTIRCGSGTDTANVDRVDLVPSDCEVVNPLPVLRPGACTNILTGSGDDEVLTGTTAGDRIKGLGGTDIIRGLRGDDCLIGGSALDKLTGHAGRDRLAGQAGDDVMSGGPDNDRMSGGAGDDRMSGGAGNDRITGNAGGNRLSGGAGNDRINSVNRRRDTVNCGRGGGDIARIDRRDRTRGCERVSRPR